MAEKPGPEKFAPPERRAPGVTVMRQQRSGADPANGPATDDLNAAIQRVAGDSLDEIDRVIRALENVRDMMRNEGDRVSREIAGYASLSHAATTAMRVIANSIHRWKDASGKGPGPVK